MKFLIVSDLHGRKPILSTKDFDAIIVPGDVCDDRKTAPLFRELFRVIKKNPDVDFWDIVKKRLGGEKAYNKIKKESVKRGNEILKELDKYGKPIFMVPGNHDESFGNTKINMDKNEYNHHRGFLDLLSGDKINPKITKGIKNLKDCQFACHFFNDVNIIGYGLCSGIADPRLRRTKFKGKQKERIIARYNKLLKKLGDLNKQKKKGNPTLFLSHSVPYNTKLDVITDDKSYAYGMHLGSTVARWYCKKYQPLICIGGHIHEHFGKTKIGKTVVVNTGFGPKKNIILEIKDGKIKKLKFVDGAKKRK
jgi:Icc-related predicted phosphoesterase